MDRNFLSYFESELTHLRELAGEFGEMHPTVARNLSLDSVPCPDPYVERLLEGVAFLGARTRQKLDLETSRQVRTLMDALYPDIAANAPGMTMARLQPGRQLSGMTEGHRVKRGTRLVAGIRPGLNTRAIYTTAQEVDLWPLRTAHVDYLQDRSALGKAGAGDGVIGRAEAGVRIVIERTGSSPISDLSLDRLDLYFGGGTRGPQLFDAIFGSECGTIVHPKGSDLPFVRTDAPKMVGLNDDEGLLPRVRPSFEGYRLLREYFLMPERFFYARLNALGPVVKMATGSAIEIVILLSKPIPELSGIAPSDFALFVTPIVNLFERECNLVEIDKRRSSHVVHADRTKPRDYEIYRLLRVEDVDQTGDAAKIVNLYAMDVQNGENLVYTTDRRPRRPSNDEVTAGKTRTTYRGDDFFVSVARPVSAKGVRDVEKLDIRALCTNRDIPILDDTPKLTLEAGDPIDEVVLLRSVRRPRSSLSAEAPGTGQESGNADDLMWRWIAQLSLSQISTSEEGVGALAKLLALYADRGDPQFRKHGRSVVGLSTRDVIERNPIPGPICFTHGTEVTIDLDTSVLSGSSQLLLSALVARLLARDAAINAFVRTRVRLQQEQEEITWPLMVGNRTLI